MDQPSARLSEYGEVRFAYSGEGSLTLRDGGQHACRFEAAQLESGEVLLLCTLPDPQFFFGADTVSFRGTQPNGWTVEAEGLISITYLPTEKEFGSYIACHVSRLTATAPGSHQFADWRFGLKNLRFSGTEAWAEYDDAGQITRAERVLRVSLVAPARPTVGVMIRENATRTKTARRLGVSRTTAITAEAVVEQVLPLVELWEVIDNLAILLSIARGTRIQAVYAEGRTADAQPIKRVHHPGLSRPFNAWTVLSHEAEHASATRRFIEKGYPLLLARGVELDLFTGVFPAYIDARGEHDFLEVRGVKIAVVSEMLKTAYLRHPAATVQEFTIRKRRGVWAALRRKTASLAASVRCSPRLVARIKGKPFRERTEFHRILRALLKYVGMSVKESEIRLFVASRNSLIHKGRFYTETAKPEQRRKLPPLPDKLSEYCFLISFLDRLMLKTLGYSGPFVDWSKYPAHETGTLK